MHFENGIVPQAYKGYIKRKLVFIAFLFVLLCGFCVAGISLGSVKIGILQIFDLFFSGTGSKHSGLIIFQIRLPQTLAAVTAGAGLACSGSVMQSVLKNPLASPFTLGISHAAAFGAALSVMIFGSGMMASSSIDALNISNPVLTVSCAFFFSMSTALLIMYIARKKGASAQVIVLTGVALGSLFVAGTMLLQFFADDIQLAAMVFWTFGDLARADWNDLLVLGTVTVVVIIHFHFFTNSYNAMSLGDETAKGLGVNAEAVRLQGMLASSLATAVIISFVGIISFIGLVAPHIVRRIIGDDHRFLIPATMISGSVILLASDIAARTVLLPHVLPVSIFTSFLGAPVFIYLIIKGN